MKTKFLIFLFSLITLLYSGDCGLVMASGNVEVTILRHNDISFYEDTRIAVMVRSCLDSVLIQYPGRTIEKISVKDLVKYQEL